jgi:hypothetical protein
MFVTSWLQVIPGWYVAQIDKRTFDISACYNAKNVRTPVLNVSQDGSLVRNMACGVVLGRIRLLVQCCYSVLSVKGVVLHVLVISPNCFVCHDGS